MPWALEAIVERCHRSRNSLSRRRGYKQMNIVADTIVTTAVSWQQKGSPPIKRTMSTAPHTLNTQGVISFGTKILSLTQADHSIAYHTHTKDIRVCKYLALAEIFSCPSSTTPFITLIISTSLQSTTIKNHYQPALK